MSVRFKFVRETVKIRLFGFMNEGCDFIALFPKLIPMYNRISAFCFFVCPFACPNILFDI